jgi:hypothetical protein
LERERKDQNWSSNIAENAYHCEEKQPHSTGGLLYTDCKRSKHQWLPLQPRGSHSQSEGGNWPDTPRHHFARSASFKGRPSSFADESEGIGCEMNFSSIQVKYEYPGRSSFQNRISHFQQEENVLERGRKAQNWSSNIAENAYIVRRSSHRRRVVCFPQTVTVQSTNGRVLMKQKQQLLATAGQALANQMILENLDAAKVMRQ